MKFYFDIIGIYDYNQVFWEFLEKGKISKQKIVKTKQTLEKLFSCQSLYSNVEEDIPNMIVLDKIICGCMYWLWSER